MPEIIDFAVGQASLFTTKGLEPSCPLYLPLRQAFETSSSLLDVAPSVSLLRDEARSKGALLELLLVSGSGRQLSLLFQSLLSPCIGSRLLVRPSQLPGSFWWWGQQLLDLFLFSLRLLILSLFAPHPSARAVKMQRLEASLRIYLFQCAP